MAKNTDTVETKIKEEPVAETPATETPVESSGSTEVALANNTSSDLTVVDTSAPNEYDEFLQDATLGKENITTQDMSIPFIGILQKLSPQLDKMKPDFIKGAEEGGFYNNVSRRVWPQEPGLIVVPCLYVRRYSEWRPRNDKGGGLVKDWGQDPSALENTKRNEKGQDVTPQGTTIQTAATFFSLLLDPNDDWSYERCIISFHATQFKKGKGWNTAITNRVIKHPKNGQMFSPAMFFSAYHLTSVPEMNDQGSWYGWAINRHSDLVPIPGVPNPGPTIPGGNMIYKEAKMFAKAVQEGLVTVQQPLEDAEIISGGDAGAVPF